ncbi:MAG: GerMN domain-containing protein [Patescibacteria group bacterium]
MDKKTILIVVALIIVIGVISGLAITAEEPEELEPNPDEEIEEPVEEEGEDEEGSSEEDEDNNEEEEREEGLSDENSVNIYFLETVEGEEIITPIKKEVTSDEQLEEAILLSLLEGPNEEGLSTAISEDTELLSLNIEDGVATADFSSEIKPDGGSAMVSSIQDQITNTLEQFDSVEEVVILVEGEEDALQP